MASGLIGEPVPCVILSGGAGEVELVGMVSGAVGGQILAENNPMIKRYYLGA